jgi:hypothetical protein
MVTTLTAELGRAAGSLGQCAKTVRSKATPGGLTPLEYERLVGLGIACDWLYWARSLQSISYSDRRHSKSEKTYGLQELTRFTFMWTATNALFARPAIIELLDPTISSRASELDRFRVLFGHCGLPSADVSALEATLHSILALPMHVNSPWCNGPDFGMAVGVV